MELTKELVQEACGDYATLLDFTKHEYFPHVTVWAIRLQLENNSHALVDMEQIATRLDNLLYDLEAPHVWSFSGHHAQRLLYATRTFGFRAVSHS